MNRDYFNVKNYEVNKNEDWTKYRPKEFTYNGKWIRNWFSNFELVDITINGIRYKSVENYYQAQKTLDRNMQATIAIVSPSEAKKIGKSLKIREDWEDVKQQIMEYGLINKFLVQDSAYQLLDTKDEVLIEWNNWNDKIWGVSIKDNKGANLLGKMLMQLRSNLTLVYKK